MYNRPSGARGLVFGGLMAALVVVCALVPFLSFFMPIPLVLVYLRYGGRVTILASVVAVLFAMMFIGPIHAFLWVVPGGVLPGMVFGYGFRHKLKLLTIGLIAVVVFFMGYAATYVVTRAVVLNGRDPIAAGLQNDATKALIDRWVGSMEKYLQSSPATTDAQRKAVDFQLQVLHDFQKHPAETFWALLPSIIFFGGVFSTWLNYMLCRVILPRFGHAVPIATPFQEFRLPTWLVWVFALAVFGSSQVATQPSIINAPWWVKLLQNVISPLMLIFVLAGMAAAYGFMRKKEISKGVSSIGILAAFYILGLGLATTVFLMLAMWDTIFDFRSLGHGLFKRREEHP